MKSFDAYVKTIASQIDEVKQREVMEEILAAVKLIIGADKPDYFAIYSLILAAGYAEGKSFGGLLVETMEFLPDGFIEGVQIAGCQYAKCKRNRSKAKNDADMLLSKVQRHK